MNKLLIITFVFLLVNCTTTRNVHNKQVFTNAAEKIPVKVKLFHFKNDSTRVYFSIDTRKQDYYLIQEKEKFRAAYDLQYVLTAIVNGTKQKLDTAKMRLVDLQNQPLNKTISGYFEIKSGNYENAALKLYLANIDNHCSYENNIKINKNNCESSDYYLISNNENVPLLDKNFIESSGIISAGENCNIPELYKLTGGNDYPVPPFADDDFGTNNNYGNEKISLTVEGNNRFSFTNIDKGYYYIFTKEKKGISFYHYTKWYPLCNDTSAFYEPLIYITSREEFDNFEDDLLAVKKTFEDFWVKCAGSKEKARNAIKEYYKRVFESNFEYTAIKEGWRTDRGMIHIVFGKPWKVEKHMNKEIWIYHTSFNNVLTFEFYKVDNPYSENDYHLIRDPASKLKYKQQWYNAVENWRNGRAFTLNGN